MLALFIQETLKPSGVKTGRTKVDETNIGVFKRDKTLTLSCRF